MVCRGCGSQIPDDSVICPDCGGKPEAESEAVCSGPCDVPEDLTHIKAFDMVEPEGTVSAGRKKGKRAVVIVPILAAAAVLVFLCYYSLPKNRYKRVMRRAEEHLNRLESVLAAEEYRKALKLMPDSEEAQEALYVIWSTVLDEVMSLADGRCFDEALARARILPEIDPERSTMNRSAIMVIYKQWVRALAEVNDPDGIEEVLSEAADDLTAEETGDIRDEASRAVSYYRIIDMLNGEADRIISLSEEGNTEAVFTEIDALTVLADQYMDLGGNAPFVFGTGETGKELGYFFSGYDVSVVIGKLDLFGIAEGEAEAYYAERFGLEGQCLYWYRCEWKDGRPNGYCEYHETDGIMSDDQVQISIRGNLCDGDWDGEVEETYSDGETYTIRFEKGRVEVISIEETDRNVVGYNKNGDKKRYYSDQAVSYEHGVPYMYYN